jgi:beta-glucanase (GH16 family)
MRAFRSKAAGLLVAVAALAGSTSGASASAPTAPAGYTLTWSDDFTGPAGSAPSSANWITDTGTSYPGGAANWGTGEVETYTGSPANLQLDGSGDLQITPVRDKRGNWTSARIETQRTDFQAAPGGKALIQARIAMPNITGSGAAGYWPAFWTLGDAFRGNYQNWPGIGEYDIMENVNGINSVWGTLHCGTNPGGPCNETNGLGASTACPNSACQGNFHTYGLEWDRSASPEALRWYVDGVLFHTVTSDQMDATTWANATHHGHFILLNVAMGGAFPNAFSTQPTPTRSTVSGVPMIVDYVAVYNA